MDDFIENFAEAVNLADIELSPETRLQDLPNWDSLAILTTISMIDMEYGVTVSGVELQNCTTLGDLMQLVESRKG